MNKSTILMIGAALLGGLLLGGCQQKPMRSEAAMTTSAAPSGSGSAGFDQALQDAKAAMAEAKAVGGLWRDTGKILKQAEKAAAAGDYDKAIELANTAEFQGKMGKKQALEQDNVGNPGYLY